MSTPANNPVSRLVQNTAELDYRILKSVASYEQAQELVDRLSDGGFPVEKTRIVGTGLRSVEQVTGRMTTGKAAVQGAIGGLWFGLMIGILFLILAPGNFLLILLLALGFGAVWGAIFGALGHAATRGRRDFSSVQVMEAESYDVLVEASHINQASQVANGQPMPEQDPEA
ncbi:general stress protein [Citricoccus sp.]|uniref:general stress protein n=1 Tax=Citricoccus sp. TaxID=1978372 RepID=UPI0028BDFD76|nr:general stress protein [Citricoccus sp.]